MGFRLWLWSLLFGSRAKALASEGRRLLKSGNYIAALEAFRQMQNQWPERPDGYLGMGRAYHKLGLRYEAGREMGLAETLEALKENPENSEARLKLAKGFLEKEMYPKAAGQVDYLLGRGARNKEVLDLAQRVFRFNRNFDKAEQVLGWSLEKEPLSADLYQRLAQVQAAQGRKVEARTVAALAKALLAVTADPGDAQALTSAVNLFLSRSQPKLALFLAESAMQSRPESQPVMHVLANLHMEQRRAKEAVAVLKRALALDPADPKGHLLLAKAYLALGEEDKAAEHRQIAQQVLDAVQGADPLQAEVLKVQMLLKNERLAEAQKQAQNLAQNHPEDWRGHYARGLVFLSQGDHLKALKLFQKAAAAGGQSAAFFISFAEAHAQNEDAPNALDWAQKAVRLEPRDPGPRLAMAAILRSFGYINQAVREEEVAESLQRDGATGQG